MEGNKYTPKIAAILALFVVTIAAAWLLSTAFTEYRVAQVMEEFTGKSDSKFGGVSDEISRMDREAASKDIYLHSLKQDLKIIKGQLEEAPEGPDQQLIDKIDRLMEQIEALSERSGADYEELAKKIKELEDYIDENDEYWRAGGGVSYIYTDSGAS